MSVSLDEHFALHGEEVLSSQADALREQGIALILKAEQGVAVNLQGLQRANSLTVALLVAWYRTANLNNKAIEFVNLSGELRNIVTFSGLSDVLLRSSAHAQ